MTRVFYQDAPITYEDVEKWVEAAVLAEREACAKVCEEYGTGYVERKLGAAIRARKETQCL